jgi:hypothetical protein
MTIRDLDRRHSSLIGRRSGTGLGASPARQVTKSAGCSVVAVAKIESDSLRRTVQVALSGDVSGLATNSDN